MSSCQEHLAGTQRHDDAIVVRIKHRQQVPLAVLQVLCRRRGYEARGVASHHRQLAVQHIDAVIDTGHVEVGQPLGLHLDARRQPQGVVVCQRRASPQQQCQQDAKRLHFFCFPFFSL